MTGEPERHDNKAICRYGDNRLFCREKSRKDIPECYQNTAKTGSEHRQAEDAVIDSLLNPVHLKLPHFLPYKCTKCCTQGYNRNIDYIIHLGNDAVGRYKCRSKKINR